MDLYIDNKRADILRDSFAVNWKWLDVTNILKRYTVASTNMTIPFSPINNDIFAYSNISGSDLTPIWNEKESKIYFGNYLALTGMLKTNKIGITDKNFQTSITGTNGVKDKLNDNTPREIFTSHATANMPIPWSTFQLAIDALFDGATNGWMLPFTYDGFSNITIPIGVNPVLYVIIGNNLRMHELWLNVADFLIEAFSLAGVTLKVFDGGSVNAFISSAIYAVMREEYLPAYHISLIRSGVGTEIYWTDVVDRTFDALQPQTILNADLLILGDKTTWELLKIICQHFNLGIYIDQQIDQVTLFDLNTTNTATKDWTDKVIDIKKSPIIKGYASNNFIKYRATDNLDDTFGQIEITNNTQIEYLELEKLLGTIDIGIPGIYDEYDANNVLKLSNMFRMDYFTNKDIYKYPIILNRANQETVQTINIKLVDAIGTLIATKALYKMAFLDTNSYFGWIEDDILENNEFYECKIKINLADLVDLNPWDMITIKNISAKLYVNQIKSLNFNKPATVELVKLA